MSNDIVSNLQESDVDNLKLVLLDTAKSSVHRLYTLNKHLSEVENMIFDKIYSNPKTNIYDLMEVYKIIRTSVQDITKLLKEVTSDPTVMAIVINNNQIVQNNINAIEESNLVLDKDSRLKVRQAINSFLSSVSIVTDNDDTVIVEDDE